MSANHGGPAFPVEEVFDERRGEVTQRGSEGMTLRDYFAAKAMEALLGAELERAHKYIVAEAYMMADAMLVAREVQS